MNKTDTVKEALSIYLPVIFSLLFMFIVMVVLYLLTPLVENPKTKNDHINRVIAIPNDVIEYCDKDSHKVLFRITDIEFKILNRTNIVYLAKENDKEIVIYDNVPENCYVNIITRK